MLVYTIDEGQSINETETYSIYTNTARTAPSITVFYIPLYT